MEGRPLIAVRLWRGLAVMLAMCLLADAAHAQRVQFPSQVYQDSPIPGAGPPAVTLDGSITPVQPIGPQGWDPYADPNLQPPPAAPLYPQEGVIRPDGTIAEPYRAINAVRLNYTWVVSEGSEADRLGIQTAETNVTAAFPFFYNPAPMLVTPGFAFNFLDGPDTPPDVAQLPPVLYDAYIDASWKPVITTWLSGDLGATVGVFSDFRHVTDDSIRVIARGLAAVHFTSRFAVTFGVVYLDRNKVKLLPAGGFIWTPNEDTRWEVVFPYPRIEQRWTTIGTTDVWWYVRGEYGGGAWTIDRESDGGADRIDINDIRVASGIEFRGHGGITGYLEAGFVWDREVIYVGGAQPIKPDDTILVGGGLRF